MFTTSLPHVHKLRPQNKPHCNKCQIPVRSSLNYRIFPTRPSICKKQIKKGREKRQRTLVSKSHIGYLCKRKQQQQKKQQNTSDNENYASLQLVSNSYRSFFNIIFFFPFHCLGRLHINILIMLPRKNCCCGWILLLCFQQHEILVFYPAI